jgi:hypothetical protein
LNLSAYDYDAKAEEKEKRIRELEEKSVADLQNMLEVKTRRHLAEMLDDFEARMQQLLDRKFEEIVGALLGFDRSFGRWELRSNSDKSATAIALAQIASAQIQLLMPDALDKLKQSDVFMRAFEHATARDFEYKVRREVSKAVDDWIEKEAKDRAEKAIATLKTRDR